jgi:hypothetical protein
MGKKKRKQKQTVYVSLEGKRERAFFDFLKDLYKPCENNINITPDKRTGGSSDTILTHALNKIHNQDKVFALFDEDVALSEEIREKLAKAWCVEGGFASDVKDKDLQAAYNANMRNPILIVSFPCAFDGF